LISVQTTRLFTLRAIINIANAQQPVDLSVLMQPTELMEITSYLRKVPLTSTVTGLSSKQV